MSEKPEDNKEEINPKAFAISVVQQAFNQRSPNTSINFGDFMSVRQFGNSNHVQLTSFSPGNESGDEILVFANDYEVVARVFNELAKRFAKEVAAKKKAAKDAEV